MIPLASFSSPVAMRLAAEAYKTWADALRIEAAATEQRKSAPAPVAPVAPAVTPGFVTVEGWEERHDWPSASGLRAYIHDAAHNGFEPCIVRIGRRILLDEAKVLAWIEGHREAAPAAPKAKRGRKSNLKPEFHPDRVLKIAPRVPVHSHKQAA